MKRYGLVLTTLIFASLLSTAGAQQVRVEKDVPARP